MWVGRKPSLVRPTKGVLAVAEHRVESASPDRFGALKMCATNAQKRAENGMLMCDSDATKIPINRALLHFVMHASKSGFLTEVLVRVRPGAPRLKCRRASVL